MSPPSLARERRAFENAAIEAALDYRNVVCGMDTAAGDHTAGKITVEEFIERSVHAHTDSISAASTQTSPGMQRLLKFPRLRQ